MSRSKQEAVLLEERIEKIRRQNEEIRRRHEEVEADKKNAAKLNALVQVSAPTEDWTTGGKLQTHHQNTVKVKSPEQQPYREGSARGRHKEQIEYVRPQSGLNTKPKTGTPKCYSFRKGDGPPPDPSYGFLADADRDNERGFQTERRGRGAGHQRGSFTRERDRGGSHFRGGHSNRGRSEGDASRAQYEAWRAERNRIDSDRISRQKTAEGYWRREWDNEKIAQDEEDIKITVRDAKYNTPKRNDRKPSSENIRNSPKENYRSSGTSDEGTTRIQESLTERGASSRKGYKPAPFQSSTPRRAESNSDSWDDEGPKRSDRSVINIGESIKICIRNSPSPAVAAGSTVKSVKVNPPLIAGTGRVGPRQRIRVSYSSQSEDEAVQQVPRNRPPRLTQHHNVQSGNDIVPTKHKSQFSQKSETSHEESAVELASSKPPLPPASALKHESSYPKPKRQRSKKLETDRVKKSSEKKVPESTNRALQDKDDEQRAEDVDKTTGNDSECGGDGDDSWEDVTTTSGNESVSEYPDESQSPKKKPSQRSVSFKDDNIQISFQKDEEEEVQDSAEENLAAEDQENSYIELHESSNLSITVRVSENTDDGKIITITEQKTDEIYEDQSCSPGISSIKDECERLAEIVKEEQNTVKESTAIAVEAVDKELLDSTSQDLSVDEVQDGETKTGNENISASTCSEDQQASGLKDTKDQDCV